MLRWRRVVCSPEHFSFHLVLLRYARGLISAKQAADELREAAELYEEPEYSGTAARLAEEIALKNQKENETYD